MIIYSENIYTPEGVRKGYIEIEGKIIRNICTDENELKNKSNQIKDYTDFYIIPGFIDNHVHGWGTGSFWKEGTEEAMYNMKKDLVKVGVTSFLGTTGADSLEKITDTLKEARKVIDREKEQITGAEMTGIHLEGPFIGKEYKGMQKEEYCINPDIDILKEIILLKNDMLIFTDKLEENLASAIKIEDLYQRARFYANEVKPTLEKLREKVDKLEEKIATDAWPIPSYYDLLFNL